MKRRYFLTGSAALSLASPLRVFAQSQVPQTLARPTLPPLSAYAGDPGVEFIALSPDAKTVAFVTPINEKRHVVITDVATRKAQTVPLGDNKVRDLFFASHQHLVVVTSSTAYIEFFAGGRKEVSQVVILDIATFKTTLLFNRQEGFYNIVTGDIHVYQRDGKSYIAASNVSLKGQYVYSLYEFELGKPKPREIDVGTGKTISWVLDDQGTLIARSSHDYNNGKWVVEFRNGRSWKKTYEYVSKLNYPSLLGLGRDGKSVVLSFDEGPLKDDFVELRADGSLSEPIEGGRVAAAPLFHPNSKRLCGFYRYDDWIGYDYFDPLLKKIAEGANTYFEEFRYRFYDFADDPRKAIVYYEGDKNSGAYSLMDFSTGKEISVGESYPKIAPEWIVQKQKITYRAADDLEITAYLTLPPFREAKNLPLIVLPHGGPAARDRLDFDWQVEALAARGYCVLQPNFRGSTGYGVAFVEAGYGQWGKKMQTDLSDGVRHLAKKGTIDPKRVAIYGASYGGYAALAGAAFDADVYRCAISVAGPSDLKAMLDWEKNEGGSGHSTSVLYWKRQWADVPLDEISPAEHADAIKIPILLIHGKNDTVVPIDQSRRMNSAMKAAKKDVTFIEFDKEDHWQSLAPARLEMIEAIMDFLAKHNPAFV
jgi:dipeptidyl aminopeptidase/acylaminoacyl peptidase